MKLNKLFIIIFSLFCIQINSQTIFPFRDGNKWFYVDTNLKAISKTTYQFCYPIFQGCAVVKLKGKYGLINSKAEQLTKCIYDTINYEHGYPIVAVQNKKQIILDINGKIVKNYPEGACGGVTNFTSYLWTYKKNKKIGILKEWHGNYNDHGYWDTLPAIYDELLENGCGIGYVKVNSKWGAVNSLGVEVLSIVFDSVQVAPCANHYFCYTRIKRNNLFGYANYKAEIVVEPKYQDAKPFIINFALVKVNNKWGYIDSKGREYFCNLK
jgi:hypothetical protein